MSDAPLSDADAFLRGIEDLDRGLDNLGSARWQSDSWWLDELRPAAPDSGPDVETAPLIRPAFRQDETDLSFGNLDLGPRTTASQDAASGPDAASEGPSVPASIQLFRGSSFECAIRDVTAALGRRDEVVVVTGADGAGMTTLCQTLALELGRRTLAAVLSAQGLGADGLLHGALVGFGVMSATAPMGGSSGPGRDEMVTALHAFGASLAPLRASAVLMVDDAHLLGVEGLEQLRALLAASTPGGLQIVLAGHRSMFTAVEDRGFRDLARRIVSRIELSGVAESDVRGYVARRLESLGRTVPAEFDDAAVARLFALSEGNPRALNRLCDQALQRGFQRTERTPSRTPSSPVAERAVRHPDGSRGSWMQTAAVALLLTTCTLAGASAAVWVFFDRVHYTIASW